jgi:hypothetical protein
MSQFQRFIEINGAQGCMSHHSSILRVLSIFIILPITEREHNFDIAGVNNALKVNARRVVRISMGKPGEKIGGEYASF